MQNHYALQRSKILKVIIEAPDTKSLVLGATNSEFQPGQFLMVGLLGIGEVPISISGAFNGNLCITIKKVGTVTSEIHNLSRGDTLFVRGPLGKGFDVATLKDRDILIVAGGLGFAPLRPLIHHLLKYGEDFGEVCILYGARTPNDLIFREDLKAWSKRKEVKLLLTVDNPTASWKKDSGVVTTLLKKIKINPQNTIAVVCGPPIMMRYTVYELLKMRFKPSEIILSLERHMKCGMGKCGHCYSGEKFVCLDGPVFRYSELLKLKPEIEL